MYSAQKEPDYRFACGARNVFAKFSDSGVIVEIKGLFPVALGGGLRAFARVRHRLVFAVSAMTVASIPAIVAPIILDIS